MKKLLALLLAVCVICSTFATVSFAAEFTDVPATAAYYPAVSLLSSLGIINGYPDGSFGPENDVTRAEFTVMLMRAMGNSGLASNDMNNMPFTDVESVVSWAGGDIKTAYTLKIVNGMDEEAKTFAPNEQVTYEQALKMVVCALGYYQPSLDVVGGDESKIWPDGYMGVATTQLRLNNGIKGSGPNPAKRWEIAKILENALEVELLEDYTLPTGETGARATGKNLLNDKLGVYYSTGDILSDEESSIVSDKLSRKGEATIYDSKENENVLVYTGNVSTKGLVGLTVKYYYKEDMNGNKTLVHIEKKTSADSVLTLTTDMIDKITGSYSSGFEIDYYENPSDRYSISVETTETPRISINGRAVESATADEIFPESGEITLIDSDNDGDFEKISVISYVTYVAKAVNTAEYIITDMYKTSTQYKVDMDNSQIIVNITDPNGNAMSFSNISNWSVVSVKESSSTVGKSVIDMIVSKESVTGSITSISDGEDVVEINNKEYEVSNYYKTYAAAEYATWEIGSSGKFYLDKDGKIAAYDKSDSTASSTKYGYLIKAQVAKNSENAEFYLVPNTTGSAATRFAGASRITVDGEVLSEAYDIVTAVYTAAGNRYINMDGVDLSEDDLCTQVVQYSLNNKGEINMIDTVDPDGTLAAYENNTSGEWSYSSSTFTESSTKKKVKIDNSTFILFVPEEGRTEYDSYSVKKYSSSLFKTTNTYTIEAYDVSGAANTAKALVVFGGNADTKIERETPTFLVTNIASANNNEGFAAYKVTGYETSASIKGEEKTYFTEDNNLPEGFAVGNVVRFATNSKGYIKASEVQVLIDIEGTDGIAPFTTDCNNDELDAPTFIDFNGTYGQTGNHYYRVAHGLLWLGAEDDTGSYGYLAPTGTRTKAAVDAVEDEVWMFTVNTTNTKFFTYDASQTDKYKVTAHEGTLPLSGYSYYGDAESGTDDTAARAQEIFVYEANGTVRMVYIIRRGEIEE